MVLLVVYAWSNFISLLLGPTIDYIFFNISLKTSHSLKILWIKNYKFSSQFEILICCHLKIIHLCVAHRLLEFLLSILPNSHWFLSSGSFALISVRFFRISFGSSNSQNHFANYCWSLQGLSTCSLVVFLLELNFIYFSFNLSYLQYYCRQRIC